MFNNRCNYVNFKRNAFCLKCCWKRPKSLNSQDSIESSHDLEHSRNPSISFVQDGVQLKNWQIPKKNDPSDEDSDFWSDNESDDSKANNLLPLQDYKFLESFPITGGKTATSQDPLAREKWKDEMSRRNKGLLIKESRECSQNLLGPFVFLEAWSWLTLMMILPHGFRAELIIKIWRRHNQIL